MTSMQRTMQDMFWMFKNKVFARGIGGRGRGWGLHSPSLREVKILGLSIKYPPSKYFCFLEFPRMWY